MYTTIDIENIKSQNGKYASWAIWDFENESNTSIIEKNLSQLHSNFILIGLNISKEVGIWENFRGGKHDRKIKYAFNSIPEIKGAYMTDLIKKIEVDSNNIYTDILNKKINLEQNLNHFINELALLKITSKTKFILFGNTARELYDTYYEKYFQENKVYYFKHYSGRGTDKEWVEYVWDRLNINDLNFELEVKKYKNHI